ncbi:myb domain protein 105 [Striga asiatica]|uniref:Myb domain protein 105 n=1 Tax=Striga asiatica TaxID=4170 RepID=A0A5A7QL26_STRAF|nr:myb domain protein 105 [Striga asiatica]
MAGIFVNPNSTRHHLFGENQEMTMFDLNASLNEDEFMSDSPNAAGGSDVISPLNGGQPKLCSRGHWRPAEDSKLRELVALYGPQNWNLIAEKLQGRSGAIS